MVVHDISVPCKFRIGLQLNFQKPLWRLVGNSEI